MIRLIGRARGDTRRRAAVLAVAALVALAGEGAIGEVATTSAAAVQAEDQAGTTALRTAMTWTVLGRHGDYAHFGSDARTSPYAGDTPVDQFLPVLCLLVDGRPAPGGLVFDMYNGWARGAARATGAVRGDVLTSQARGDAICAENFGAGWRLAEFHDGRYGPGFAYGGGWSFWAAAGQLLPNTRYWVAINDQPANAWNSVGDLPPPVQWPPEDVIVKTRLQEIMQPLLGFARDQRFRDLVNAGVARQHDGDTDVLLADLIRSAESAQLVDPNSPPWRAIKDTVAYLRGVHGGQDPHIYIPNYGDGAVPGPNVTMVLHESDMNRTSLPGYQVDAAGNLQVLPFLIDETYTETNEVWALTINEGPDVGDPADAAALESFMETSDAGTAQVCGPEGLRHNRGLEYLSKIQAEHLGSIEPWIRGKIELRLVVLGKGGQQILNHRFPKIARKKLKRQRIHQLDLFVTTWDRVDLGAYWYYDWWEVNKVLKLDSVELNLGVTIGEKLQITPGIKISVSIEERRHDIGGRLIAFREPTTIKYAAGALNFWVCSNGGQEDNWAMLANASASTTYPFEGYSPNWVNDGSRSTRLGGLHSWANAASWQGGNLPQWVQLNWTTPVTFNELVVYTTEGYPIQNYEIQMLTPAGAWQRISVRTGNTATMVVHDLAQSYTAQAVRILGTMGPNIQPQHVRVNEFEVYNR
jgi:hypothetical protein